MNIAPGSYEAAVADIARDLQSCSVPPELTDAEIARIQAAYDVAMPTLSGDVEAAETRLAAQGLDRPH